MVTRRWTLGVLGAGVGFSVGGLMISGRAEGSNAPARTDDIRPPTSWGRGFDGQRIADRGDGTFINPVFSGDRPDPPIIRDGDTYYPEGDWWLISHGYENGYWTLGRQCLLEPVRWRPDGWFETTAGDLSEALPKPAGGRAVRHGLSRSDDFDGDRLAPQWTFYKPEHDEASRVRVANDAPVASSAIVAATPVRT